MKNKITNLYVDEEDEGCALYRVDTDNASYIKVLSKDEAATGLNEFGSVDFSLDHELIKVSDCTLRRDIDIVRHLFTSLWDSCDEMTTYIPTRSLCDMCEVTEDVLLRVLSNFSEKHIDFFKEGVLEVDGDGKEIGIFYKFFEYFDIGEREFHMFNKD